MKEQKIRFTPIPSTAEVEAERERLAYRSRYMRVLRSTVYTLLVVAAIAVLLATLFLPVLATTLSRPPSWPAPCSPATA